MCQFFRIFFTPIATKVETIDNIVTSCAILHNVLRNDTLSRQETTSEEAEDVSQLPDIFIPLSANIGRPQTLGVETRNKFMNYFVHSQETL